MSDDNTRRDARRRRLRRRCDQGAARPRRRAQAPGHVHRRHRRRLGPAPHGLRGRRQRRSTRRLAGYCDAGRRHPARRRLGHGARQRPRHPGRHPRGRGRLGRRGDHDRAARRREVRPELLQGLGRPARRRRRGGQRALGVARSRIWRDGKEHFLRFRTASPQGDLQLVGDAQAGEHGTEVTFLPSTRDLHQDRVRLRHPGAPAARAGVPELAACASC